jgi:hypothetical protein
MMDAACELRRSHSLASAASDGREVNPVAMPELRPSALSTMSRTSSFQLFQSLAFAVESGVIFLPSWIRDESVAIVNDYELL